MFLLIGSLASHLFFADSLCAFCIPDPNSTRKLFTLSVVRLRQHTWVWPGDFTFSLPPTFLNSTSRFMSKLISSGNHVCFRVLASEMWGLGRSPGEGNGNPLQYSCQNNPMDRGAWQTTIHGVQRPGYNWVTKHACMLVWDSNIYWEWS